MIQSIDVPQGWEKTGLLPYNASAGRIDDRAMLFHRPNNYFGMTEGFGGLPLSDVNNGLRRVVIGH